MDDIPDIALASPVVSRHLPPNPPAGRSAGAPLVCAISECEDGTPEVVAFDARVVPSPLSGNFIAGFMMPSSTSSEIPKSASVGVAGKLCSRTGGGDGVRGREGVPTTALESVKASLPDGAAALRPECAALARRGRPIAARDCDVQFPSSTEEGSDSALPTGASPYFRSNAFSKASRAASRASSAFSTASSTSRGGGAFVMKATSLSFFRPQGHRILTEAL